jgi:serine/threonine protein phosphatase 1
MGLMSGTEAGVGPAMAMPVRLPAGQRVYAIGDVHGCDGQLAELHRRILADLAARPVAHAQLVHLGDYIDRGLDSAGVLARLMGPAPGGLASTHLIGNHETMMLAALAQSGSVALSWLDNGGDRALESWGLSPLAPAKTWRGGIPRKVLKFIEKLPRRVQVGPYVFVHAGLRPGVALAAQEERDMLWIRQPFLDWEGDLGVGEPVVVVHGHSPEPEPVVRANRIGIDTGCVMGGRLTAAVLQDDELRFLQV